MNIATFIASKCTQTAVYWGNPTDDGYAGKTFTAPVEIACRWEDKDQILGTQVGGEVTGSVLLSRSVVFVTQDLEEEGCLYLGTLAGLTDEQKLNPKLVDGAYSIKRFEKTPALASTTDFLRKAFLTPFLR